MPPRSRRRRKPLSNAAVKTILSLQSEPKYLECLHQTMTFCPCVISNQDLFPDGRRPLWKHARQSEGDKKLGNNFRDCPYLNSGVVDIEIIHTQNTQLNQVQFHFSSVWHQKKLFHTAGVLSSNRDVPYKEKVLFPWAMSKIWSSKIHNSPIDSMGSLNAEKSPLTCC